MDFIKNFQPHQIVCLEHEDTRLYAEVIQVVASRQLCWARPLALVVLTAGESLSDNLVPALTDLRSQADLLWPLTLFRPALDTEVIPLLANLSPSSPQSERDPVARQQLYHFIYQVWQGCQEAFA